MVYKTLQLPDDLVSVVKKVAQERKIAQDKIIELALREFFEKHKGEKFRKIMSTIKKIKLRMTTFYLPITVKVTVNLPKDLVETLEEYAKENKIRIKSHIVSAALFEYFVNHMPDKLIVQENQENPYAVMGVKFSEKTYLDLWHLAGVKRVPVSYIIEDAILEFLNKYENMDFTSVLDSIDILGTELYGSKAQISVHMARTTRERLEEYARKNNTTMSIVVRAAVKLYLDKIKAEVK
ncbi:MAG: hypothetical protein QXV58_15150 [Saccharolobus sp.]|uniref:hypothetical protein n=1 Tax=Saccharolobus sp. TaxID=2100761 RepID=UPI0031637B8C